MSRQNTELLAQLFSWVAPFYAAAVLLSRTAPFECPTSAFFRPHRFSSFRMQSIISTPTLNASLNISLLGSNLDSLPQELGPEIQPNMLAQQTVTEEHLRTVASQNITPGTSLEANLQVALMIESPQALVPAGESMIMVAPTLGSPVELLEEEVLPPEVATLEEKTEKDPQQVEWHRLDDIHNGVVAHLDGKLCLENIIEQPTKISDLGYVRIIEP
ncbi:hypothetical protein C8J56DRAFT_1061565 [Mycena floridula]|nr:hypothetical protein C8J56DRAFT_1061565 [Mycena floridula]